MTYGQGARGPNLLLLALLGFGWGLHVVLSKALGARDAAEAMAYLSVYMAASAFGLIALGLIFSRPFRPRASHLGFFIVSSILGYLGPIMAELLIAPRIDAGLFALIASLTPVLTAGLAAALGLGRLTGRLSAALAAGSLAAVLMVAPDLGAMRSGGAFWPAVAFVVPVLYACDQVYIQVRWPESLDVFQVSGAEAVVALGLTCGLALAWGVTPGDMAGAAQRGGAVLGGLVIAALATVWLFFYLLRECGAVFVSFAGFVSLATGVICGVVFFGERPTLALAAAAVLTVVSLWLLRADTQARQAESLAAGEG